MTGLALVRGIGHVVNVRTGVPLELATADIEDLADAREALTRLDTERNTAASMLDEEIVRRTDEAIREGKRAEYSYIVDRYRIQVDATPKRRVHEDDLRRELLFKADNHQINLSPEAVELAFTAHYRLGLRKWAALVRTAPEVQALYLAHSEPLRRRVKVERLPGPRYIDAEAEEVAS
jgi:hypothetical protein